MIDTPPSSTVAGTPRAAKGAQNVLVPSAERTSVSNRVARTLQHPADESLTSNRGVPAHRPVPC